MISEERAEQLLHMKALLEDSVEYYCDEHVVSGAWQMVAALAEAKLKVEFPNE